MAVLRDPIRFVGKMGGPGRPAKIAPADWLPMHGVVRQVGSESQPRIRSGVVAKQRKAR